MRGVEPRGGIVEIPPLRLAFLADPDGNPLYLYQRA